MTMECRVAVESNDLYNGMSVEYQMKQKMVANKVKSKVNLFRDSRSNYPVYHYHAQSSFYLSNRPCKRIWFYCEYLHWHYDSAGRKQDVCGNCNFDDHRTGLCRTS